MALGKRVREQRLEARITQQQLADLVGTSQSTINSLESRDSAKSDLDHDLAEALGVTVRWLRTGEYPKFPPTVSEPLADYNAAPGPDIRGLVPVISWVQAGAWHEAEDHFVPGDGDDWLPCPVSHGLHTYALRVEGDSMTAPFGKSYPAGCVIFVDPDQAGGVVSGQRVIAKINGEPKVTFKVFVEEAGSRFLKPLNPQYPIITDPFRVIGRVIGKWEDE